VPPPDDHDHPHDHDHDHPHDHDHDHVHPHDHDHDDAAAPVDVDIDRLHGVTITWADGRVVEYGLVDLRRSCTCAECRGKRERGQRVGPAPGAEGDLSIVDAELHGGWGIAFTWSDGHSAGIYAWEVLAPGPEEPAP
jgi:DUF971 family protein